MPKFVQGVFRIIGQVFFLISYSIHGGWKFYREMSSGSCFFMPVNLVFVFYTDTKSIESF